MDNSVHYMDKFQSEASQADVGRIARQLPAMKRGPVAKVWDTAKLCGPS